MTTTEPTDEELAAQINAAQPTPEQAPSLSRGVMAAFRRARKARCAQDKIHAHNAELARMKRAGHMNVTNGSNQTTLSDF